MPPPYAFAVTTSGNEITDASRALGVQGDGRTADSSFGIWEATTNLENSAGADVSFESATTGYTTGGTNTIASDPAQSKFGTKSCKATYQNNATLLDIALTLTAAAHSVSRWIYIPTAYNGGGVSIQFANYVGATGTLTAAANMSLRDQWQQVTVPNVTIAGGDLIGNVQVVNTGAAPTAGRFIYIDGAQTEAKATCTPFTIAPRSAARAQAPASLLNATQGAVALRWRMGWGNTNEPRGGAGFPFAYRWYLDPTHYISVYYNEGANRLGCDRWNGAGGGTEVAALVNQGDFVTAIGKWDAAGTYISFNGGTFVFLANTNVPSGLPSLFDIGSDSVGNPFDSDLFWAVTFTGTLTDADAATINSWGNTDPTPAALLALSRTANPTMLWDAATTTAYMLQTDPQIGLNIADQTTAGDLLISDSPTAGQLLIADQLTAGDMLIGDRLSNQA